jgi:hypothetical protein
MTNREIVRRLEAPIAILAPAHYGNIVPAQARIRADEPCVTVLKLAATQSPAGKVMGVWRQKTAAPETTIKQWISTPADLHANQRAGGGRTTAYRGTGLV